MNIEITLEDLSYVFYFILFLGAVLTIIAIKTKKTDSTYTEDSTCIESPPVYIDIPPVYSYTKTSSYAHSINKKYSYNGYNNYNRRVISKLRKSKLYL